MGKCRLKILKCYFLVVAIFFFFLYTGQSWSKWSRRHQSYFLALILSACLMSSVDSVQWVATNVVIYNIIHCSLGFFKCYLYLILFVCSEWKFSVGDQAQWDICFIYGKEELAADQGFWPEGEELRKNLQACFCKLMDVLMCSLNIRYQFSIVYCVRQSSLWNFETW